MSINKIVPTICGSLSICKTNIKQILEIVYIGNIQGFRQRLISTLFRLNTGYCSIFYTEKIITMTQSWLPVGPDIPSSNQHLPVGAFFPATFAPLEVSLIVSIAFDTQFWRLYKGLHCLLVLNISRKSVM